MGETNDLLPAERPIFRALLVPHRSLGRTGFLLVMGAMVFAWLAVGSIFLAHGAWPIFGFFGLDVLLLYVMFRLNYRDGRLSERLRLTERELQVDRVHPDGRVQRWSFQPYWLRVEMDDPPQHESRLLLASHGETLAIGAFLTPEERLDVARALRDALHRLRGGPATQAAG